ncbi:MAG: biopolymer transporter ExbD [Planctomycetes bacterium]|nr:biopolymer transporter ExbD [Planctomycetota bacterium]MBI3845091.1 biopolymer transporter ExbD [Planctomycetota bacterium]
MAGSQDPNENPVAINVVPMVDVIFCLCVFFMCSFKFKQLEGKFDSWLPRNKGVGGIADPSTLIEEIRVAMFWDAQNERAVRQLGQRRVDTDQELQQLLKEAHDDYVRLNKPDVPVTIDADARIPWREVVNVVNICKRDQIDKIEFAFGAPPGH